LQLPGGVDLTLTELQDMAARQQHQIENQQQVLVAKEQRLKYLKQQEQKQQQITAENERLKKLRDRIETQEMKLKKLRELRGEVEKQQSNNGNLSK
jgi:flagellar motility protein MotE (MotC chaperone)